MAEAGWLNTNESSGDIVNPAGDITITSEHDITTAAPQFVDTSRDMASWGGTEADALSDIFTISGYDDANNDFDGPASGVTLADLIAHVQDGFAPQNAALQGTGEGGVDIGAVDVVVPPTPSSGISQKFGLTMDMNL